VHAKELLSHASCLGKEHFCLSSAVWEQGHYPARHCPSHTPLQRSPDPPCTAQHYSSNSVESKRVIPNLQRSISAFVPPRCYTSEAVGTVPLQFLEAKQYRLSPTVQREVKSRV